MWGRSPGSGWGWSHAHPAGRYHSLTRQLLRKAEGVVLMYDVTSRESFTHVRYWLDCLQVSGGEACCGVWPQLLGLRRKLGVQPHTFPPGQTLRGHPSDATGVRDAWVDELGAPWCRGATTTQHSPQPPKLAAVPKSQQILTMWAWAVSWEGSPSSEPTSTSHTPRLYAGILQGLSPM